MPRAASAFSYLPKIERSSNRPLQFASDSSKGKYYWYRKKECRYFRLRIFRRGNRALKFQKTKSSPNGRRCFNTVPCTRIARTDCLGFPPEMPCQKCTARNTTSKKYRGKAWRDCPGVCSLNSVSRSPDMHPKICPRCSFSIKSIAR